MYKQGYNYDLTEKEKSKRNEINKDYEVATAERDALLFHSQPGDPVKHPHDFMTVHQILDYLHQETTIAVGYEGKENLNPIRLNKYELVKSLSALSYPRGRKWMGGKQVRGYYIIKTSGNQPLRDIPATVSPVFNPEDFGITTTAVAKTTPPEEDLSYLNDLITGL